MAKQYLAAEKYEAKLARVMKNLEVKEYNYNFDRRGTAWVEFKYKEQFYRFEHSVEKAKSKGIHLAYGSDAFAQIVLSLEDLARMVRRGIYDLQTWVSGMKYLPPAVDIPSFFKLLGFDQLPSSEEEIKSRFKSLAKQLHPDAGGKVDDFIKIKSAADEAIKYFKTIGK